MGRNVRLRWAKRPLSGPDTPGQTKCVSSISVRRVRPADEKALVDFYARLSPDSRHARFLGCVAGVGDAHAHSMCEADHRHAEGFVAATDDHERRIVGHVMMAEAGGDACELAIAVTDDCQGQGIGRRLFDQAIEWAVERGLERVVATAFADNWRVLRLLSSAPHGAEVKPAGSGVVTVVIPLRPGSSREQVLQTAA